MASSGKNLVQGMANLVQDMSKSGDVLSISQTDVEAFEVGRNVATAPGKVVFQNDLIQLIQYAPSTDAVHATPLLIVPPWINKFYILDLGPQKSFIRYMVGKGFTVFVVSWVNPDERLTDKTFEDYMTEGLLAATDAVKRETGDGQDQRRSATASAARCSAPRWPISPRAARSRSPPPPSLPPRSTSPRPAISCCSSTTTQLKALEEMMAERGYLDGSRMATVFNMLRPRT